MEFLQTIKQIGIFMICAQAILHFKPSAKYEKYLKLLISVMVLVQLLVPVVDFFSGQEQEVFFQRMEEIQAEIDREMEQLEIENAINEENILKETKLEIQNRVNEIASNIGLTVSYLQFIGDGTGEAAADADAGKLMVYVQEKTAQSIEIPWIEIVEIRMEDATKTQAVREASAQIMNQQEEKLHVLRKEIAKDLGIMEEEIEVFWYG